MKILAFDIWGDFAHFRKYYTTSSPLTFSFPPPPTISGILGAIYGCDKFTNEYLKLFGIDTCNISLKILSPIKKTRIGLNLINTKDGFWVPIKKKNHEPRTQIPVEFVKNPKYRIFFHTEDEHLFEILSQKIENHSPTFTISLGLSELLANFEYIGQFNCEKVDNCHNYIDISTPIVADKIVDFEIEQNKKYFKEKLPIKMDTQRIVERYNDIVYESQGCTIKTKVDTYYRLENGENIVFF